MVSERSISYFEMRVDWRTWDVTIPDTLAASHLDRTSLAAGAATEKLLRKSSNMSTSRIATTFFDCCGDTGASGVPMHRLLLNSN